MTVREDFAAARRRLADAAVELSLAFDAVGRSDDRELDEEVSRGYPGYLPSFDEFARDVVAWRDAAPTRLPPVGMRFRLVRDVERFPWFIAGAGMTGEVVRVEGGAVYGRMDQHLDGAEQWDNEVEWAEGADTIDQMVGDLEATYLPGDRWPGRGPTYRERGAPYRTVVRPTRLWQEIL